MDERSDEAPRRVRAATRLFAAGLGALLLAGCGKTDGGTGAASGPSVKVQVAALELTGIEDATYDLAVYNHAGDLVWTKPGLTSTRFGSGAGDLAYVGPCDSMSNPNRVELTVVSLSDRNGPLAAGTWQNPTADGPLVQEVPCTANRDAAVTFNLTILRQANQGFFDVAVEFEDIFCSAKLDCVNDKGEDLELLFDPKTEQRGVTVVMGFACTAGGDTKSWLHLNDVHVMCDDGTDEGASYWFNPTLGPGNIPGQATAFFGAATYRGREQLPGYDKCYWNMAFGVNEGPGARSCVLTGEGTATDAALVDRRTPGHTAYPFVKWQVTLTDANGQLMCGRQPLNEPGSQVTTRYTPLKGSEFSHSMQCETQIIDSPPRQLCAGRIEGVNDAVAVKWTAAGVSVAVGGAESPPYAIDAEYDVGGCCLNPCCTVGSPALP